MYTVLLTIQYIGIVILFCELIFVFRQKPSRLQTLMLMILGGSLINFVGYLFEMKADTLQDALTAVKILYFGKPFIAFGIFLFVLEYLKIKLPSWLVCLLALLHIMATTLVLTCENQNFYYTTIEFVEDGVFPHLKFGHGLYYILYSGLLLIYLIVMMVTCVNHLRQAESNIEKKRSMLLAAIAGVSLIGFVVFFTGITKGYDSTIPAYVISNLLMLILLMKCGILDTLSVAKDSILDDYFEGLVILDNEDNLLYFNNEARRMFPEIKEITYRPALDKIIRLCETQEKMNVGDEIYEVTGCELKKNQETYGKFYLISNITESYSYTKNLERQKSIAEQANRAKTDFLARMSHEIRTPINSVLGMNEMILRESGEPEIRGYAANVRASANSLLNIINDILDSTKIESGKMDILTVDYELDGMLNDLVNMIYTWAEEKELQFEVIVDPTLPNKLIGDDVRIKQVLTNLLTNAVKYTQKGKVRLTVGGMVQDDKVVMHYEVADTGIGIREEDLSKLFEAFERIDEVRNRNIEGTGLGMNIVMNLLEMMESKLKVDSVYGSGSTFSFDLIQYVRESGAIGDFQGRIKTARRENTYHAMFQAPEAKVLVVDDNEINRQVFSSLLKRTEIQVTEAASGEQCLELIKKEHFDAIFLDHMMPGMDGIQTLRHIKAMEEHLCKNVPVIVLTANAVSGAREQYLQAGFDNFLSKPLEPNKLEQLLMHYLPEEYIIKQSEQQYH